MLIRPAPRIFRKRPAKARRTAPPPVLGPVLADAEFDADKMQLTVEFDRAVSVAGFVPATLLVNDPASAAIYRGTGAAVFADVLVIFDLEAAGPSSGSLAWMSASAGNGIVATDDESAWAGVAELGLPYL